MFSVNSEKSFLFVIVYPSDRQSSISPFWWAAVIPGSQPCSDSQLL